MKTVLFAHERRNWLDRGQKTKYRNCEIVETVKGAIRSKACQSKLPRLTKQTVCDKFDKACVTLKAFPSRWYRIKIDGDCIAEPLLMEIEKMIDIIGSYMYEMYRQDERDASNKSKQRGTLPCTMTVDSWKIDAKTTSPVMKTIHHKHIMEQMKANEEYTIFHVTDSMMGIDKDTISDRKLRSKERSKF